MDSQSKNDLIFYGALGLLFWWLASRNKSRPLTWQVDPQTGNLVPAQAPVNPLLPLIATATNEPLVSSEIVNNSTPDPGNSGIPWVIDPATGQLRPAGSSPGASGGW